MKESQRPSGDATYHPRNLTMVVKNIPHEGRRLKFVAAEDEAVEGPNGQQEASIDLKFHLKTHRKFNASFVRMLFP